MKRKTPICQKGGGRVGIKQQRGLKYLVRPTAAILAEANNKPCQLLFESGSEY
jgi:hypothetical protein